MKILSINSSPRTGGQSKTELILNHLVEGMKEAPYVETVRRGMRWFEYGLGVLLILLVGSTIGAMVLRRSR